MKPATDQSRPALRAAKLNGLVERFRGQENGSERAGEGDVGLASDDRGYYLADSPRALGPAIAWARSKGIESVVVFADADLAPHLARRAALLSGSTGVEVVSFTVNLYIPGGDLQVSPSEPGPVDSVPELPVSHLAYMPVMVEAGTRPTDDFGRLVAEVEGLEVARVTGAEANPDDTVLEVGVGLADRELQLALQGGVDDEARLRQVVEAVRRFRYPGAGTHPLSRIGRQRWLRSMFVDNPGLVDATLLASVPPLRASETVLRQDPAAAFCEATNTMVVCQVGADLDLIPEALDLADRQNTGDTIRLVVAVPARDLPLVSAIAPSMVGSDRPVELLAAPEPWSST